jgi:biotin-(acetyl-CoA carboxylase) ligase
MITSTCAKGRYGTKVVRNGRLIAGIRPEGMLMRILPVIGVAVLGMGINFGMPAQTAGQDIKKAGSDTKNAAKETGSAAKKTAKTTGSKVKHGTHKAAQKVADKTKSPQ